jgi:hypothetical protein
MKLDISKLSCSSVPHCSLLVHVVLVVLVFAGMLVGLAVGIVAFGESVASVVKVAALDRPHCTNATDIMNKQYMKQALEAFMVSCAFEMCSQ